MSRKEADIQRQESRNATIQRHSGMRCRTRKLKLQVKSRAAKDYMRQLFLEAKWFTNQTIAARREIDPETGKKTSWKNIDTTGNTVETKNDMTIISL